MPISFTGIQRLGKISVGVDGGHLGLVVPERGLRDRYVPDGFAHPRAQAVAETVPAKTLTCSPRRHFANGFVLQREQQCKGYLCLICRIDLFKLKKT
jgi:hypothetical protein